MRRDQLKRWNIIGLLLFILMAMVTWKDRVPVFDRIVSDFFAKHHTPFFEKLFIGITYLNSWEAVSIISVALTLFFLIKHRFKALRLYLFSIITAVSMASLLKLFIVRHRPEDALLTIESYAFPSWHATLSVVLALLIYTIFVVPMQNRRLRSVVTFILLVWPLLIGFTRLYLNVHWCSDVLAGWGLGLFITTGSLLLFHYPQLKNHR